jgi:Methyltransferase domain
MALLRNDSMPEKDAGKSASAYETDSAPKTVTLRPFGRIGAARYDNDTRGMPRRYHVAHAIQNELVLRSLNISRSPHPVIVDLGCGTANDGLSLLSRAENAIYVGIDYSSHMLARAATKLTRGGYKSRNLLLDRDFRELTRDELVTCIEVAGLASEIRCVISAIALHHYDIREKRSVYQLAFNLLPKGGLLILSDLYTNSIGHSADWAWAKELFDIRNAVERLESRNKRKNNGPSTISEHHYREENRPQILTEEVSLLGKIGFAKIDVVYRNGQLGVLVIEK